MRNGRTRRQEGKIIKPYYNEETAPYGNFHVEGSGATGRVHAFVCMAFHGPRPDDRPYACHRDGDRLNSVPSNLYWGTAKENQADRLRHPTTGAGEAHPLARLTEANIIDIRSKLAAKVRQREIAAEYGISQPQVSNIKHGRRWAHA